jgi:hypothetical protein
MCYLITVIRPLQKPAPLMSQFYLTNYVSSIYQEWFQTQDLPPFSSFMINDLTTEAVAAADAQFEEFILI